MRGKQQVAYGARRVSLFEKVAQRVEIPRRLRHLGAFNQEVLRMNPVAHKRLAVRRLALRDFVFMVRENKVNAAGMDIDSAAEYFAHHRRAFYVPAGPPPAERRFPERFAVFRGLPQREIAHVVFLVFVGIVTKPALHLTHIEPRKSSIALKT